MGLEAVQIQQLGLIGNSVLWNGQTVTLIGVSASGTDAYLDTGHSSTVAPLSELDLVAAASRLVSNNGHFTSPGVFRAASLSEAATCSVPAEEDPSLQACFDPSNPENLDEILRQSGSSDETMRDEGRGALREAARQARAQGREEEFNNRVREALEQIGQENPCEVEGAQQAFSEVQSTLPSQGGSSNGGGNPGSGSEPRSGGGAPIVASTGVGGGTVGGLGTDGAIFPAEGLAFSNASLVAVAANLPEGDRPVSLTGDVSSDSDAAAALPVVAAASVPVALSAFTLAMPAFLTAAAAGALEAPRNPDVRTEAGFFQNLFDRLPVTDTSSGLVDLLTNPTAAFASKVYEVRRATADVMRAYRATYGSAAPFETSSIPLSFRYNPERRRIEVAIHPSGSDGASLGRDREERPSRFSDFSGSFRSLSLFRLGSDDHRAGPEFGFGPIVAFVPVPQQYLQGVRVGDGVVTVRADGRATDRGVERLARRDSARDDRGGSHPGDREGSRGGRGGGHHREDSDAYPYPEEDLATIDALVA